MATTFYPPHIGGVEYHVENLSKLLVKKGHHVTIFTSLLPNMKMETFEKKDGVEILRTKTLFLPSWLHSSLSSVGFIFDVKNKLANIIEERSIDVIHAHGHHYPLSWAALDVASELSVPSVLTLHGMYAINPENPLLRGLEERFNLSFLSSKLKKVSAIIGLTPKITDFIKKYGCPSGNYFTIPNGIDLANFEVTSKSKYALREKYSIPTEKFVILFRGRFSSVKGVLELAEAAVTLSEKNNNIFFVFVGNGPLKNKLKQKLSPIKDNSKILGWTPVNEIPELYLASDFFVLPSKWEALPITILEALASSLYIVATPVGGVADIIEKYPRKTYIRGTSPRQISESLEKALYLFHNENTPRFFDVQKFNWENISVEIENVYKELC